MSDTTEAPSLPNAARQSDELLAAIRTALAQDAAAEVRAVGALACRAILAALDPTGQVAASGAAAMSGASMPSAPISMASLLAGLGQLPSATPPPTTSPMTALLGAIGKIPREQLLEVVAGLRWLFGGQAPTYLPRPMLLAPSHGAGQ